MHTQPLRQILDRQLERIRKPPDDEHAGAERARDRHLALGAQRILRRGTLWATPDEVVTAARAAIEDHQAHENRRRQKRRLRAKARRKKLKAEPPDPTPENPL